MLQQSILRHLSSARAFAAPAEGESGVTRSTKTKTSVPSAGKSPFAHLARNAKAADEDDKDDKEKDAKEESEGEEDDEEDEDKGKSKKSKKSKKAEEDDDADAKDGDEDDKKSKKSKKADDGDDDSDRDDDDDPEARAARARERGRIRAIVTSDAGKLNPVGAMHLACDTAMSRRQAIGTLQAMGTPAASAPRQTDALRDRMASVETPDVGAGDAQQAAPAGSAKATAAAIIAAGKKRRGEKD